jgi:hypothetical protein
MFGYGLAFGGGRFLSGVRHFVKSGHHWTEPAPLCVVLVFGGCCVKAVIVRSWWKGKLIVKRNGRPLWRWQRVNTQRRIYLIRQGVCGDEFVKFGGKCVWLPLAFRFLVPVGRRFA